MRLEPTTFCSTVSQTSIVLDISWIYQKYLSITELPFWFRWFTRHVVSVVMATQLAKLVPRDAVGAEPMANHDLFFHELPKPCYDETTKIINNQRNDSVLQHFSNYTYLFACFPLTSGRCSTCYIYCVGIWLTVCGLIIYPTLVQVTKTFINLSIFTVLSQNLEVW